MPHGFKTRHYKQLPTEVNSKSTPNQQQSCHPDQARLEDMIDPGPELALLSQIIQHSDLLTERRSALY